MKPMLYSSALLSLLLLGGCGSNSDNTTIILPEATETELDEKPEATETALDKNLSTLIPHLTGDPSTGRNIPSIDDSKAQLGMKLNYTKTMSLPGDTACVSCHHPLLGGGDGVQLAIGTGAVDTDIFGYDRVLDPDKYAPYHEIGGGPSQAVNSPTHYNSALQDRFMAWNGVIEAADPIPGKNGSVGGLYDPDSAYEADGSTRIVDPFAGADVPATQARFPVQNPLEMANFDDRWNDLDSFGKRQLLLERFTGTGNSGEIGTNYLTAEQRAAWQTEFKDAEVELTDINIYNMISYFEQTLLFIENPWKKYVEGDLTAISEDAKKGAILFFSSYEQGGANCTHCHNGDFFTDNALHVMAVPQIGLGTQENGDSYGREEVTNQRSDRYKWRTMSLLNIEKTGPWGHDGAFTTLKAMVQHMVDPSTEYDANAQVKQANMQNLEHTADNHAKALEQLEKNRKDGISPHQVTKLDNAQIDQIVAFLETLTDPRLNDYEYMNQWIPENNAEAQLLDLQVDVTLPDEATQPKQ